MRPLSLFLLLSFFANGQVLDSVCQVWPIENILKFTSYGEAKPFVLNDAGHFDTIKVGAGPERFGVVLKVGNGWEFWPLCDGFWNRIYDLEIQRFKSDNSKIIMLGFFSSAGKGFPRDAWSVRQINTVILEIETKRILFNSVTFFESSNYEFDSLGNETMAWHDSCGRDISLNQRGFEITSQFGESDMCELSSYPMGKYEFRDGKLFFRRPE